MIVDNDYDIATDVMFGLIKSRWDDVADTIAGTPTELFFQGVETNRIPPGDRIWGRVSRQTIEGGQKGFAQNVRATGQRRWTEFGLVFVQLFAPAQDAESQEKLGQIAIQIRNVLRRPNKRGVKVWFRKASIKELPPENRFNRLNVVAEFNYDEIF